MRVPCRTIHWRQGWPAARLWAEMACLVAAGLLGCSDDTGSGTPDSGWDAARTDGGSADAGPGCGNGILEPGEACDDGTQNSDTEPNRCRTDCTAPRCGDGVADTGEECDGLDLRGEDCSTFGLSNGRLRCGADCLFDLSDCRGCGNGLKEDLEECDGTDLGGLDCRRLGFDGGQLSCTSDCQLDTADCWNHCGNGLLDFGEECDGTDLGGASCADFGLEPGVLRCGRDCRFDLSGCLGCGNGIAEEGEFCDGTDLKGLTCVGRLSCTSDCLLDASGCILASAGDGSDGVLLVEDVVDLSQREATAFPVVRVTGRTVFVDGEPELGLEVGDEVLLLVLQGCEGHCDSVGTHEFFEVEDVDATRIVLHSPLTADFGLEADGSVGCLKVVLQRVPHFRRLSIRPGGILTTRPWDGRMGGVLVFRVSEELEVSWGGLIDVTGLGFRGGEGMQVGRVDGMAGESICGPGAQDTSPNQGGGGGGWYSGGASDPCGQGGGGGGYGGPGASPGFASECRDHGNANPPANGGQVYGGQDLSRWYLGSGGGSGATDDHSDTSGSGGRGGGLVVIMASRLLLAGEIRADGTEGGQGSDTNDSGNGGGGSGGTVWIRAGSVDGSGYVTARGGPGRPSQTDWNSPGGDGGPGRIRVDFHHAWGYPYGRSEATWYLQAMCDPDPGVLALLIW